MRLDVFLKVSRIVPRRSGAGDLCRQGKVQVNGKPAKAGRQMQCGDRVHLRFLSREILVEVLDVPLKKGLSKVEARTCYALLEEKRYDLWGREIPSGKPTPGQERT